MSLLNHSAHLKTKSKNYNENKPNQPNFTIFIVSGLGMVWTSIPFSVLVVMVYDEKLNVHQIKWSKKVYLYFLRQTTILSNHFYCTGVGWLANHAHFLKKILECSHFSLKNMLITSLTNKARLHTLTERGLYKKKTI